MQFINSREFLFLKTIYNVRVKVEFIKVITYFYIIANLIRFIILRILYYAALRIIINFIN